MAIIKWKSKTGWQPPHNYVGHIVCDSPGTLHCLVLFGGPYAFNCPLGIVTAIYPDGTVDIEDGKPANPAPPGYTFGALKVTMNGIPVSGITTIPYAGTLSFSLDGARSITYRTHPRASSGALICQGNCGELYPYAEPPADGPFVCRSCRTRM